MILFISKYKGKFIYLCTDLKKSIVSIEKCSYIIIFYYTIFIILLFLFQTEFLNSERGSLEDLIHKFAHPAFAYM